MLRLAPGSPAAITFLRGFCRGEVGSPTIRSAERGLQDLKALADVGQFLKLLAPHGEFDVNDFAGPKAPSAKARAKRRKS